MSSDERLSSSYVTVRGGGGPSRLANASAVESFIFGSSGMLMEDFSIDGFDVEAFHRCHDGIFILVSARLSHEVREWSEIRGSQEAATSALHNLHADMENKYSTCTRNVEVAH